MTRRILARKRADSRRQHRIFPDAPPSCGALSSVGGIMGMPATTIIAMLSLILAGVLLTACSSHDAERKRASSSKVVLRAEVKQDAAAEPDAAPDAVEIPERVRAWMDTLTVPSRYDPATGFIVAEEVTALPPVFTKGDDIASAVERAHAEGQRVIAVATADRCAPCQQYKLDALNDPRVIERLAAGDIVAVHIEVDRQPELARALVGSLGIPMTYELANDGPLRTLRGQRTGDELLAFLQPPADGR